MYVERVFIIVRGPVEDGFVHAGFRREARLEGRRGRLAKAMVLKGRREKTVGGLKANMLMRNSRGQGAGGVEESPCSRATQLRQN